jgi:hypothetical protein
MSQAIGNYQFLTSLETRISALLCLRLVLFDASCSAFQGAIPSLAATLGVARIGGRVFRNTPISIIRIRRYSQAFCSPCLADCNSLSSISFETDSELTRIGPKTFS